MNENIEVDARPVDPSRTAMRAHGALAHAHGTHMHLCTRRDCARDSEGRTENFSSMKRSC
jgi:hypothetical protein